MFHRDLQFGKQYERKFIEIMNFSNAIQSEGCVKEFDVQSEDGLKYEVKADKMASKTGNICIEFCSNGEPSGINATQSNKWAHFVISFDGTYDLYLLEVDELKEMLSKNKFRQVRGGDCYRSQMYLIPISFFKPFFHSSTRKEKI